MTHCGLAFNAALLHPRYWFTWLGLFLLAIIALLPTRIRHSLGKQLGNSIYRNNKKRYRVVNTNLKIAFPDLDKKARDQMIHRHLQLYGCAMIDYSLLFFGSKNRLAKMMTIDGQEHIDKAVANNQSVIILLAHSVMLEFAPAALGFHYDCFGSYKTSKNAVLDWIIAKSRCRHVAFVVSRDEGLRKLVKSLVPKRLMIFLPDEDLGKESAVFVPFFGEKKATLTTTARLAKMGKSIALPAFAWYDNETQKYRIQISPALTDYPSGDAVADATILNEALEMIIAQHPEQYMWMLKWYRTRPENEPTLY